MSDSFRYPVTRGDMAPARHGDSLADILERILDKGVVIAGDIRVNLLDIELLTIRIRLLISSADKAAELGMAWWRQDPFYTGEPLRSSVRNGDGDEEATTLQQLVDGTDELRRRIDQLERDGRDEAPEPSAPSRGGDDATG